MLNSRNAEAVGRAVSSSSVAVGDIQEAVGRLSLVKGAFHTTIWYLVRGCSIVQSCLLIGKSLLLLLLKSRQSDGIRQAVFLFLSLLGHVVQVHCQRVVVPSVENGGRR